MKRSRSYYTIRSIVRFTFWTTTITGAMFAAVWVSEIGQKPECPIRLNFDFTYTQLAPFDSNECTPGDNVTLTGPQTWAWTE